MLSECKVEEGDESSEDFTVNHFDIWVILVPVEWSFYMLQVQIKWE